MSMCVCARARLCEYTTEHMWWAEDNFQMFLPSPCESVLRIKLGSLDMVASTFTC